MAVDNFSRSAFSHTLKDTKAPDTVFYTMAKSVILGDQEFTNVMCVENQYVDLIGLQFIWAFDRVILDYPNQQIHLLRNAESEDIVDMNALISQTNFVLNSNRKMQENGFFEITLNYYFSEATQRITHQQDTIAGKYLFYGKSRHWGRTYFNKDSINSLDSVRLPNGEIKQAPITIDLTSRYFVDP